MKVALGIVYAMFLAGAMLFVAVLIVSLRMKTTIDFIKKGVIPKEPDEEREKFVQFARKWGRIGSFLVIMGFIGFVILSFLGSR